MSEQTGPIERFETLAEEFRRDTGMMAPGKDDRIGHETPEERFAAWDRWLSKRESMRRAAPDMYAALEAIRENETAMTCMHATGHAQAIRAALAKADGRE